MTGLRVLGLAVLLIALVATGATAQDDAGPKKIEAKTVVVVKTEKKADEECEGKCEDCDGSCEGGEKKCSGKCEKGAEKKECSGSCGGEAKACPETGMTVTGGRTVVLAGGGAPDKAMLKKALAELAAQVAKLEAEAKALRAENKTAEAEKVTAQWQQMKAHHARLSALIESGAPRIRVLRAEPEKAGGCGGSCGEAKEVGGTRIRVLRETPEKAGGCGGSCGEAKDDDEGGCGGECGNGDGGAASEKKKGACGCGGCADKPARAFLGIMMAPTDGAGVRIVNTVPMSPAALGGIKPDDVLRALNGEKVGSIEDVSRIIGGLAPGAQVRIVVKRGDADSILRLALGARPEQIEEVEEIEMEAPKLETRPALRLMGVPGGPAVGLGVRRPAAPPAPALPQLAAKLQEVRVEAQRALAAGDYGRAAELSKVAQEISMKLHAMNRAAGPDAARAAAIERRLSAVESRLARIERLLHRIASQLDDDEDDHDEDDD